MGSQLKSEFQIAGKLVARTATPLVIAEAGTAHFGSFEKMKRLVDLAVEAGADLFKTQAYDTSQMISNTLPEWQERMASRNVDFDFIKKTKNYCEQRGIPFLCTPHDEIAFSWLEELEVSAYKIGSGERGNVRFFELVGESGKPVLLSTGMSNHLDVDQAVETFEKSGCENLALLHCVTAYPTPAADVNLRSINFFLDRYPVPIGYSDHTPSSTACIAAVGCGATIIERHITLDYNIPNAQDWKVSSGPADFGDFVDTIKSAHKMLGKLEKQRRGSELNAENWAIKRLVAAKDLPAGHKIHPDDIMLKRAVDGFTPEFYNSVIGMTLTIAKKKDMPISSLDVSS